MDKMRLLYSKKDKAKYISHLDLMSTMQRALLRSGVSLKYSEGFNPHPYLSVALPLQVGCESICESLDFGVSCCALPDSLPKSLTDALPEGLEIIDIYKPTRKFSEIAWIEIYCTMYYDGVESEDLSGELTRRYSAENIVVLKRSKKGTAQIDIVPYIKELRFFGEDNVTITAKISAQNPSLNTENILSALSGEFEYLKPDFVSTMRNEIFDKDMMIFR